MEEKLNGPLTGVKVLDLTHALAGPYCTLMLGDFGADVIKIEMPVKGDESRGWGPPFLNGESVYHLSANRNKKSLTLNLKSEAGKDILARLVQRSDVLVENFTPGTMDRLGFSYSVTLELNPGLIYCSISGFGQTGPDRMLPAYDLIVQGMAGMMSITGHSPESPTKFAVPIGDIAAGMFGAFAISSCLVERQTSGKGQFIDTSMLGGQVSMLVYQAMVYFATQVAPGPSGNHHALIAPYGTFRTGNGFVNVAAGNEGLWQKFCLAVGLEHLLDDPRFRKNADRVAHKQELIDIIEGHFKTWTVEQVLVKVGEAKVPCGPIYNLAQVFDSEQVKHLGLVQHINHPVAGEVDLPGMPYRLSRTPGGVPSPPPLLGQHTNEVLKDLGFSDAEIEALRRQEVV